jgi:branched-chain amino acid aminotransferase
MEYTVWLNGEFVPASEAKVGLQDRGLRLGDVVFDTSRTFNGTVFRLRDHLDRLFRSLTYTRMDPGYTLEELEELTLDVVQRNESVREPGNDYMITQFVTRGEAALGHGDMKANVAIWIDPIDFPRYGPLYTEGAHAVIPKVRSYSSEALDPKVKHYSRLNFVLAELEAQDVDSNAFPVLLDVQGNITEGIGYNFFIVTDGVLRTPGDRDILQGISRKVVLELADQLGIPTSEEDLQPYDAYTADEAFLSSSGYCILPVGRIDNRSTKGDVPGPITQRLLAAWSEMVGVDIVDQALQYA